MKNRRRAVIALCSIIFALALPLVTYFYAAGVAPKAHPTAAPTARAPKASGKERKTMPLAHSYIVADAGASAFNGEYVDNGATLNGVALFELDATHVLARNATFDEWRLYDIANGIDDYAYGGGNATDPLTTSGAWFSGPGSSTPPPPTVTIGDEGPPPEVGEFSVTIRKATDCQKRRGHLMARVTGFRCVLRSVPGGGIYSEESRVLRPGSMATFSGLAANARFSCDMTLILSGEEVQGATVTFTLHERGRIVLSGPLCAPPHVIAVLFKNTRRGIKRTVLWQSANA